MEFKTPEEEREYLCGLAEGERVVEQGNSMTTGWQGTTYMGSRGMCVRWDNILTEKGGQLSTSITHGTRRLADVSCPYVARMVKWQEALSKVNEETPKTSADRTCQSIARYAITTMLNELKCAKAGSQEG